MIYMYVECMNVGEATYLIQRVIKGTQGSKGNQKNVIQTWQTVIHNTEHKVIKIIPTK